MRAGELRTQGQLGLLVTRRTPSRPEPLRPLGSWLSGSVADQALPIARMPAGMHSPSRAGAGQAVLTALLLLLASCHADSREAVRSPVTDTNNQGDSPAASAESPPQPAAAAWHVDPASRLRIGRAAGDPEYLFERVNGVQVLENGRIAIADAGSESVRLFDASGHWVATAGGFGGGPGEYRGLKWIGECSPDTLYAYDAVNWRITEIDADGGVDHMFTPALPSSDIPPLRVACAPDGNVILMGWGGLRPDHAMMAWRPDVPIAVVDQDGRLVRDIGTVRGNERYAFARSVGPMPLGKSTLIAGGASHVYVGTGDSYEIRQYGRRGQFIRTVRLGRRPVAITDRDINAFTDSVLALTQSSAKRNIWRKQLEEVRFPATLPAYESLLVGGKGCLWVEDYARPGTASDRTWSVFAPSGRLVATSATPHGLQVLDIGPSTIAGVTADSLGIQHVEVHSLLRDSPQGAEACGETQARGPA